jgi:hypothetical protein
MARKGNGSLSTAVAELGGASSSPPAGPRPAGGRAGAPQGAGAPLTSQEQTAAIGALLRGEKPASQGGPGGANGGGDSPGAQEGAKARQGGQGAAGEGDAKTGEDGDADKRVREGAAHGEDDGEGRRRPGEGEGEGGKRGELEHGAGGTADGDEGDEAGKVTPASLAKVLGVDADQVYAELEVPLGKDAEGAMQYATLETLKREHIELGKLKAGREDWEHEKTAQELRHMTLRREVGAVLDLIGPYVSPEVGRLIAEQDRRSLERERVLLREAVPEWRDSAVVQADRELIAQYLKPWGFDALELDAQRDHRVLRFLRDHAMRDKRARELAAASRKPKPVPKGQAPTGARNQGGRPSLAQRVGAIVKQGQGATNQAGKTAAIGALLRETRKG